MAKKEGLTLVVELDADEAEVFRGLTKTDDAKFYNGIAKSLVLGAGTVVNPAFVFEDIELLKEVSEFGRRGDLPAEQKWADELLYTREQLNKGSVKDAICSWAIYFGSSVDELFTHRFAPADDQRLWFNYNSIASMLLESLKSSIKSAL